MSRATIHHEREHGAAPRARNAPRLIAVIVVVLASLVVSASYLSERVRLPDLHHPTMDALFHDQWAAGLAFGTWTADLQRTRHEPYFRAPLYPYFVSVVYRVFGRDPLAVIVVQMLLGAASAGLMFGFCRRLFGTKAAWAGAALFIGYWPLTYFEGEMLLPAVVILLDIALLFAVVDAMRSTRPRPALIAGLVLGLGAITRPNILIVLPVVAVVLAACAPAGRVRRLGALALGAMLVIAPVTMRNLFVGHDFVPIAWQGGGNFYIGNNPESNGSRAVIPGTRADWWGGIDDWRRIARKAEGHDLKPSEISGYWYRRGFAFLAHDPGAAARLYLRKLRLLLGNGEVSNQAQMYFVRGRSPVLARLPVNFALVLALAAVGLVALVRSSGFSWRDPRLLPYAAAAAYAVSVLLFFVSSRHRLPVAVFLIPGAAVGTTALIDAFRARRWGTLVASSSLALVVFVASMANPLHVGALADARGSYDLGVEYLRDGDVSSALKWLNAAIAADPSYAPAWVERARARERSDLLDDALSDLERATQLDSSSVDALLETGVVMQKLGRHEEAGRFYRHALALDPDRLETLNNLADVAFRERRPEEAKRYLTRALAVDPDFPNALYGLGVYYELAGDIPRAIELYRKAGDFGPARARLAALEKKAGHP